MTKLFANRYSSCSHHKAYGVKMMKCSVSSQPSAELEPDYAQSGGQISLFPARGKAAEDFPGEFTAVFSFIQCHILIAPEIRQIEKKNP